MRMYRSRGPRRRWPRSRTGGCLMLVLLLIVVLIILSLMFGGFQKGTKSSGLGPMTPLCTTCTACTLPRFTSGSGRRSDHEARPHQPRVTLLTPRDRSITKVLVRRIKLRDMNAIFGLLMTDVTVGRGRKYLRIRKRATFAAGGDRALVRGRGQLGCQGRRLKAEMPRCRLTGDAGRPGGVRTRGQSGQRVR
jgi:hypothetical protein